MDPEHCVDPVVNLEYRESEDTKDPSSKLNGAEALPKRGQTSEIRKWGV